MAASWNGRRCAIACNWCPWHVCAVCSVSVVVDCILLQCIIIIVCYYVSVLLCDANLQFVALRPPFDEPIIIIFLSTGWSPLHCAALGGHVSVCHVLLQQPAIIASVVTNEGATPLHYLMRKDLYGTGKNQHPARKFKQSPSSNNNYNNNNSSSNSDKEKRSKISFILENIQGMKLHDLPEQVIDAMVAQVRVCVCICHVLPQSTARTCVILNHCTHARHTHAMLLNHDWLLRVVTWMQLMIVVKQHCTWHAYQVCCADFLLCDYEKKNTMLLHVLLP